MILYRRWHYGILFKTEKWGAYRGFRRGNSSGRFYCSCGIHSRAFSSPYTISFPNGQNAKAANLKHYRPTGIPIIVIHHMHPAKNQARPPSNPPNINKRILPIFLMTTHPPYPMSNILLRFPLLSHISFWIFLSLPVIWSTWSLRFFRSVCLWILLLLLRYKRLHE